MKMLKMTMSMKTVLTHPLPNLTDEQIASEMTDEAKAKMVEELRAQTAAESAAASGELIDFDCTIEVVEV